MTNKIQYNAAFVAAFKFQKNKALCFISNMFWIHLDPVESTVSMAISSAPRSLGSRAPIEHSRQVKSGDITKGTKAYYYL